MAAENLVCDECPRLAIELAEAEDERDISATAFKDCASERDHFKAQVNGSADVRQALADLVALKDMKGKAEMREQYIEQKPVAWQAARFALDATK